MAGTSEYRRARRSGNLENMANLGLANLSILHECSCANYPQDPCFVYSYLRKDGSYKDWVLIPERYILWHAFEQSLRSVGPILDSP
jgi:hypothetical protein